MLNLPGTKEYDCQRPWVFKKRVDELLDLFIYVDNDQPIGSTNKLCWEAFIRWGLVCS